MKIQRAFILESSTGEFDGDPTGNNLDELNALLADGWVVVRADAPAIATLTMLDTTIAADAADDSEADADTDRTTAITKTRMVYLLEREANPAANSPRKLEV